MRFSDHHSDGEVIAFFLRDLDGGGAERAVVALAGEVATRGYVVDLVVGDADGDYRSEVPAAVHLESFSTRSPVRILSRLTSYLRRRNPGAIMSALDVSNILLIAAAKAARYRGRTVISQRAVVDASLRELGGPRRLVTSLLQRWCFPRADAVISNSHAAARELQASLHISSEKVFTIHNALNVERIERLAKEPLDLRVDDQAPLIVSVGSLTKRKDMATLVQAFAKVRQKVQANLAIVGRGGEEITIRGLVSDLGLSNVLLVGFDVNPYRWIAAADVFVSSSTAEGFPNAIAEALALDRSIVATDCPGDTAELLQHGKWGRLVPVGDPAIMAAAILAALDDPKPPQGRLRAAEFAPHKATSAYLKVLLPNSAREFDETRQ
jgi:glycosyltransferase involved in cell wall biosynthesis